MPTFKAVVLDYKSKADNTRAVRIRITHNRKSAYIRTSYKLSDGEVTKNNLIKVDIINDNVLSDIISIRRKCADMGRRIDKYDVKELATHLEQYLEQQAGVVRDYIDFIKYGRKLTDSMFTEGRTSMANSYQTTLNMLSAFCETDTLDIKDITPHMLVKFENWIKTKPLLKGHKKHASNTAVAMYMCCIRAIFNKAKFEFNDEDRGEILITHYPFAKYKLPKAEAPRKRAVSTDTIRAIRDYQPVCRRDELARDIFMISFYLMGMNLPDIFDGCRIVENRIAYNRSKTRNKREDNAEMSVLIAPDAIPYLKKYSDHKGIRVFDLYTRYASVYNAKAAINKGIKKIGESINVEGLTLYAARHSFATIARNDCKASIDDIALCLNHALDRRHIITDKYIKKDWSIVDRVQEAVIKAVNDIDNVGRQ